MPPIPPPRRTLALAIPLALALATPAAAAPNVYAHAGNWHAFTDKNAAGKDVCGIGTTNPTDQRDLSMTYAIGGDTLTLRASKPSWQVPAGTHLNVTMQVNGQAPWPAEAVGDGTAVTWAIGAASIRDFDTLFRQGRTLTISFPAGNEPPWVLPLAGSTAASQALWRCVQDTRERDHAVSPAANAPPPTQPFTPAPASAPAQPAQKQ